MVRSNRVLIVEHFVKRKKDLHFFHIFSRILWKNVNLNCKVFDTLLCSVRATVSTNMTNMSQIVVAL